MTKPPEAGDLPAIEQSDREAAADLMVKLFTGVPGLESDLDWSNTVRAGEDDGYPTVQAFARYRAALSPAPSQGDVERVVAAFEDDPFGDDLPTQGTTQQGARFEHYARLAIGTMQLERLREALKPFAAYADFFNECEQHPGGCPDNAQAGEVVDLTVADFRRAKSAIAAMPVSAGYRVALVEAAIPLEAMLIAGVDHMSPEMQEGIRNAVRVIRAALSDDDGKEGR